MSNSTYSSQGGNVSYAVQIGLLEQLKTYLERFDTGLSNVDFKYRSQMDALDGLMLAEDWHLLNENHCAPTCAAIRRVQAFIMQESVPVLSNQIAYFSGKATSGAVDQLAAVESDLAHGAPSGDHRSWHGQIELLREFKGFLGRLEVSLSLFQINYRQQVAGLETMMMTNAHAEFAEHQLDPTLALIQRLREFIAEDSVPTVNRIIADIEGRPSL